MRAEPIPNLPENTRGRPPSDPWHEWMDGQARRIVHGVDFEVPADSMASMSAASSAPFARSASIWFRKVPTTTNLVSFIDKARTLTVIILRFSVHSSMRIAVVSDVHGNLTALYAVDADIKKQDVDLVVQGGDLVGGSRNAEVIDHPTIAAGHPLRRHVLYRLASGKWGRRPR